MARITLRLRMNGVLFSNQDRKLTSIFSIHRSPFKIGHKLSKAASINSTYLIRSKMEASIN